MDPGPVASSRQVGHVRVRPSMAEGCRRPHQTFSEFDMFSDLSHQKMKTAVDLRDDRRRSAFALQAVSSIPCGSIARPIPNYFEKFLPRRVGFEAPALKSPGVES